MEIFKINRELSIECEWKKTSRAFKHEARLLSNGREIEFAKICYSNRTWEKFKFESVIRQLLDKIDILTERKKTNFLKRIGAISTEQTDSAFNTVAIVAQLGEVFNKTRTEKNDWKTRMLKAGLENRGLIMPENWDTLSELDKEKRLDRVISSLKS